MNVSFEVFFFLALDDPPDGKISMWRVQRDAEASQLQHRPQQASTRFQTPKSIETRYCFVKDDSGKFQMHQMHQMPRYCKDLLNPVYTELVALEFCVSFSFVSLQGTLFGK